MSPYIYIELPSFAVMAFLGGFSALVYVYFRSSKFKIAFIDIIKIFVLAMLGGYIGGKALFIVTGIPDLVTNFSVEGLLHLFMRSGIVYYGGLFGVLLMIKIYGKKSCYGDSALLNMIAPAIPLFHAFGRVGCALGGCCFGRALGTPFTVFGVLQFDKIPVQLMESLFEFLLFVVILIIDKKRTNVNLIRLYLVPYAVFRLVIEIFRGDEARGIYFGLSTSQWISIVILVYYIIKIMKDMPKRNIKASNT